MFQKPWFKVFVWFLTTFFFFLTSGVIISILKPGPFESEVMQFNMGMMSAMDNSMMGVVMNLENSKILYRLISMTSIAAIPLLAAGVAGGILIRMKNKGGE
ncbi:MAG: hypothetical protein ACOZCL_13465 [Bacillota bacterium]